MKSKLITVFLLLVASFSAKAEKLVLLNEVVVQLGGEGYLVLFKDRNDCAYLGKASAITVGVSDIHIDRKTCINQHGQTLETKYSLHWKARSETRVNKFSGERVNLLPIGTKHEF